MSASPAETRLASRRKDNFSPRIDVKLNTPRGLSRIRGLELQEHDLKRGKRSSVFENEECLGPIDRESPHAVFLRHGERVVGNAYQRASRAVPAVNRKSAPPAKGVPRLPHAFPGSNVSSGQRPGARRRRLPD